MFLCQIENAVKVDRTAAALSGEVVLSIIPDIFSLSRISCQINSRRAGEQPLQWFDFSQVYILLLLKPAK